MANNQIDDEGFDKLFSSLKMSAKSGSLQKLDVSSGWISQSKTVDKLVFLIENAEDL